MYTEQDYIDSSRSVKRSWIGTGIVAAVVLAAYIYAMAARVRWLAYGAGAVLFVVVTYAAIAYIGPNERYHRFLRDMRMGGDHEMVGTVVSVSQEVDTQDGVRVLSVHLALDPEDGARMVASKAAQRLDGDPEKDERILYLNVSKAANFPPAGARVRLRCFGRHIVECAVTEAR